VVVNGRMAFSRWTGTVFYDSCGGHDSESLVVLDPKDESGPNVNFVQDSQVVELLRPFWGLDLKDGVVATGCGAFTGQIFYKDNFHPSQQGAQGNGFGPRRAYRVAFVLKSVLNIRSCQ